MAGQAGFFDLSLGRRGITVTGVTVTLHLFRLRFRPALARRGIAPEYRFNTLKERA